MSLKKKFFKIQDFGLVVIFNIDQELFVVYLNWAFINWAQYLKRGGPLFK